MGRWLRCLWLGLALAFAAPAVGARQILDLEAAKTPVELKDWGDYLVDPAGRLTITDVLRQPRSAYRPTPDRPGPYPVVPPGVVWIRFAVPATPDNERWYLSIPRPGLDLATLYTQQRDGGWAAQSAGDLLPATQWPVPHLHPVLPLAISAESPTFYLLRVQSGDGFAGPILFVSDAQLAREQQRLSLGYGVYFGLFAMGALVALASAAVLRDTAYLCFALATGCGALAGFAATGLATLHLWPQAPQWADDAPQVLAVMAFAPLLLFAAEATLVRERSWRLYIAIAGIAGVDLLLAVGLTGLAGLPRLQAAIALGGALALATIAVLAWSWRRGDPLAGPLLAAHLPLFATLAHACAVEVGWLVAWPWGTAALLASGALATSVGYLLLALRSQDRRDHRRRIARIAEIDPTTGLANEASFRRRLAQTMLRSARFQHQSVVALVEFTNLPALRDEFGRDATLQLQVRLGERLTNMLRNLDTVARLDPSTFGILVEGPAASSRLRSFCAKLIAHCITPLGGLPQGMTVRPRVAAALVPESGMNPDAVMGKLRALLSDASAQPHGPGILLADGAARSRPDAPPSTLPPTGLATMPGLEDVDAAARPDGRSP